MATELQMAAHMSILFCQLSVENDSKQIPNIIPARIFPRKEAEEDKGDMERRKKCKREEKKREDMREMKGNKEKRGYEEIRDKKGGGGGWGDKKMKIKKMGVKKKECQNVNKMYNIIFVFVQSIVFYTIIYN